MIQLLNDGWQFAKEENKESFAEVTIPHDWLISDTKELYQNGTGWYRRELDTSFLLHGQRLFIRLDGVYMDSTFFVNNKEVGAWKYGYTAFEHDITDYLSKDGQNTIEMRVVYQSPNSRWYTGAGLYRDVFMIVKNACYFVSDGIYITTYKKDDHWEYKVDAEVETNGKPYEIRHTLLEADNGIKEWSIDQPYLYTLQSELLVDGEVTDTEYTRFGFREILCTTDRGFFLNGEHMKLNGICLHHDLGALGAAVHKDAIIRQLKIFKEMGVNAIRTAHNPPAKVFMELADEMGFLVMSEILDMWKKPKTPYDYARFFDEWIERDVKSWVRRDRNHPSLIMWSVGNEIYDTHADAEEGGKTLTYLMDLVKQHDPDGHAYITFCSNFMPWENTQKCADLIKLVGYNYAEHLYEEHHKEHPDWSIYGSETCSTVQSRGIYHFPLSKSILADDDLQCSALGNSSTSWGAKSTDICISTDLDIPYSLGQFIWSGQDYIGEPTPYHTKNSYFGHVDTAGFKKDSYYLFKAAWTSFETSPMVYVYPYWDFSPDQLIDVRVCSNAPSIELFLNDKSLGVRELSTGFAADWQISYQPGTLKAVAYNNAGESVVVHERTSFGDVRSVKVNQERIGELVFADIFAEDQNGHVVENANIRVKVVVQNGVLLGLDNGDSTDYDQYQTDNRRLFNGHLLAVIQADKNLNPEIQAEIDDTDIPVRKIELLKDAYTITAQIFPQDAHDTDLEWRVTDAGGIDSPLAKLKVSEDGRHAVLIPKGDGDVYVRCAVKNGREHISLISQTMFCITGMGKALIDPYSFVAGGLYNRSNLPMTNGNERGVATLRDGESHVGYMDLDFGKYGSDELTMPLFPMSGAPFAFGIWEGMPLDGGEKLCDVTYDKGSMWNTYQEVTYQLPRRLCGVTTLCFVFDQKVHMKGFVFTKYEKAYEKIDTVDHDGIYGDSYQIQEESIEQIGNNVTILFDELDFAETGAKEVELCWRSMMEKNSIQFVFSDGEHEVRKMIEVPKSAAYQNRVFSLGERITGKKNLSIIFLPGCNIDFSWFRFVKG